MGKRTIVDTHTYTHAQTQAQIDEKELAQWRIDCEAQMKLSDK